MFGRETGMGPRVVTIPYVVAPRSTSWCCTTPAWRPPRSPFWRGATDIRSMLATIGYETQNLHLTLKAFQRHFRPSRVTGRIDFETAA